jgi:hypothetical protein
MKFKSNIETTTKYPIPTKVVEPAKNDKIYFYLEPIVDKRTIYFTPSIGRNTDKNG